MLIFLMSKDYSSLEKKFNTNYVDVYVRREDSYSDRHEAIFDFRKNPKTWKMVNAGISKPRSEILYVQYDSSKPHAYFFKYIPYDKPKFSSIITKLTLEIAEAIIQNKAIFWINPEDNMAEEFPMCIGIEDSTIEELKTILPHL
jgi:hypothetical protein